MTQEMIPHALLPGTDLTVSVLGLGTAGWGWSCLGDDCEEVMDAYCNQGGNLIDTADVYPLDSNISHRGLAEEIIGAWMRKRRNRSNIVVATKVGGVMGEGESEKGLGRKHILEAVDGGLKRLGTDYIDIYQTHWDDGNDSEETLRAFEDVMKAGKVRYIGCCSYSASRLLECLATSTQYGLPSFRTLQLKINLIDCEQLTKTLQSICTMHDISIIAYSPLAGGFLTGKYLDKAHWPHSTKRSLVESRYWKEENVELVSRLAAVCKNIGISLVEFSMVWVLSQDGVKVALFGANSVAQLKAITASVRLPTTSRAGIVRAFEELIEERSEPLHHS